MVVHCEELGGVTVCRPEGDLEAVTATEFREAVAGLCGGPAVVIDLSALTFIDSCGLGALIGAVRRIRETGGTTALCSSRGPMSRLLRTVGIDRVVPVLPSLAEAVASLATSSDQKGGAVSPYPESA